PSCTRRIEMLRGFFLIFLLVGIVIVAMCGFRGEHSTRTPWEIFPDMVRQQKVRAQSPIDFFADGRGPRVPIASIVPIGYEMAKQYGLNTVATLQDERIRKMADGEIFNTITNGKNTMMSYGGNVPVADRWAIIAYVRALQHSQNTAATDVPPEELAKLEKTEA